MEKQKKDITEKNEDIDKKNKELLEKIDNEFNELKEQNEKLGKGMEEQESDAALEEQYKKFKSNYYIFLTSLEENNQSCVFIRYGTKTSNCTFLLRQKQIQKR